MDGLKFNLGIFTNLSRDHLDYHKTFKDYFDSKLILFRKLMRKKSNIIFDEDLNIAKKIQSISKNYNLKTLSIGSNNSNLKIIDHKFVNLDQQINIQDVIILVNMILDVEYSAIADLNEDGVVNILDIIIYVNIILSK